MYLCRLCCVVRFFSFFSPFLCLSVLLPFPLFLVWFISPFVSSLLFHPCFVFVFRLMWVSSLAYPNVLGTKRLGGCCCMLCGTVVLRLFKMYAASIGVLFSGWNSGFYSFVLNEDSYI
jgi:hypothetical protein